MVNCPVFVTSPLFTTLERYVAPPPAQFRPSCSSYCGCSCCQPGCQSLRLRPSHKKWDGVRRFSLGAHFGFMSLDQRVGNQAVVMGGAGFQLRLPRPVAAREAMLGIRPEYFVERSDNGLAPLQLTVDIVVVLGSDQLLYGTCAGDRLVARVGAQLKAAAGDTVPLGVDAHTVHVFDRQTEQSLL